MRPRRIAAAAAATAAVVATAVSAAQAAPHSHPSAHPADRGASSTMKHKHSLDHVFVIMLENHSKSSVIGDENAPFMNYLANRYTTADNYYGVTHPSMPNYIAAIAGDNFGIQDDNDENIVGLDRTNLVDQLEANHVRWGAYMQDLPANKTDSFGPKKADGTEIKLYAKKHNPFVLFDDIKNNDDRMAKVKDYTALGGDLNSRHAPQFVWISPNQCNDMHGGVYDTVAGHPETPCPYGSTKDDENDAALKQKADDFVKTAVHTIRSSKAWTKHSAIVIVTDENDYTGDETNGGWESTDGCCDSPYVEKADPRISKDWPGGTYGGGLIPAIIVGHQSQGEKDADGNWVGNVDHHAYNHYSLLTTIEQNWGVGYLGHAGDAANGVKPMWHSFLSR